MSTRYGDFTSAKCTNWMVSAPFSFRNDPSRVVEVTAVVDKYRYVSGMPIIGLPDNLPPIDCGDTQHGQTDNSTIKFTRTYCDIPRSWTEQSSAVYTSPPIYSSRNVIVNLPVRTGQTFGGTVGGGFNFGDRGSIRVVNYLRRSSRSSIRAVEINHSYSLGQPGRLFTREGFELIQRDETTRTGTYSGIPVVYTIEPSTRVIITGTRGCVDGSRVTRWKGEIYHTQTAFLR